MMGRVRNTFSVLNKVWALAILTPLVMAAAQQRSNDPNVWVDPFLGVDGGGNTVPGASVPFGFVSISPDTSKANSSGYDSEGLILGFSHTHVSGTGGGSKYGNFRVTPTIGEVTVNNLAFRKNHERASPGWYSVDVGLSDEAAVHAELTATRRSAMERYTFPRGATGNLILDVTSAIPLGGDPNAQRVTNADVIIVDDHSISGSASFIGGWNPSPYTMYFFAVFDQPIQKSGTWRATLGVSQISAQKSVRGTDLQLDQQNRLGMFATFDTANTPVIEMKLAVSMLSVEQARRNLSEEMPGWEFDTVVSNAAGLWRQALNRMRVEGGTEAQRRIFYSSLYRAHQMPHDLTGENVWWSSSEPHYEDFYTLWDTFRTLHPLFTLIEPERQRDMVRSLIDTYEHTGWMPDARVAGSNGLVQGGSNGDVVIADALVKGLTGINYEQAYRAALKDADLQSPNPLNEGRELRDYLSLGYMSLSQTRSASRTMEYSYDDFAVGEIAERLGHHADAQRLLKRSANWKNLWNSKTRCIQPRYADGKWLENFDCNREYPDQTTAYWDAPYYEGRGVQYSTFVPQDIPGLIEKLGGDEDFVKWLDVLFDEKLYTQGNEQDLLAAYLYIYAHRHDRVCERVRKILGAEYSDSRNGLPGNDDAGTMSSWYVWSSIGLYPNAGQPYYYLGSPLFTKTSIEVQGGKQFVIIADGNSSENIYVQSAELNGQKLNRSWLLHEEIIAGGKLVLHMGARPSNWARDGDLPPSMTNEGQNGER